MQRYGCIKSAKAARDHTKKKTRRYKEQNPEKVNAYLAEIAKFPKEKIAYIDETGLDSYFCREYAYAPKGEVVYTAVPGRRFRRINIVAAKMGREILAPMRYTCTTDSVLFEHWFEHCLLPCLPEDAVIVMDNAAFHRKNQLFAIAQRYQRTLIFLPPYSPELNPIEKFWAWLKKTIASTASLFETLEATVDSAFQAR